MAGKHSRFTRKKNYGASGIHHRGEQWNGRRLMYSTEKSGLESTTGSGSQSRETEPAAPGRVSFQEPGPVGQRPAIQPEPNSAALQELAQVAKAMSEGNFYQDLGLQVTGELGKLAYYLNKTRKNLQYLDSSTAQATSRMPEASDTLSSIAKATEMATHRILALAEKILQDQGEAAAILSRLNQEPPLPEFLLKEQIQNLHRLNEQNQADLVEILTHLSFQDLTGQKIQKIIHLVQEVERRILGLLVAFGIKAEAGPKGNLGEMKAEIMSRLERQDPAAELGQDLVDEILSQFNIQGGSDSR